MLILQVIAGVFSIGVAIGFYRLEMMYHSIQMWINHVNDKLTRIEYGMVSKDKDKGRAA